MNSWRCCAALCALHGAQSSAHPLDEVVQGAYVTLAAEQVDLELDLTPGTEVVDRLLRSLDANADQHITETEARAYAQQVLQQSSLRLDGVATAWRLDRISVPPYQNLKSLGDTVRIYASAVRRERAGARSLRYENRYQPATSQCIANIFLQSGTRWRYRVTSQSHSDDGRVLTVHYTAARS